ncbi:hypothetical protein SCYAM73S_02736 [Streptomyces cyaneofuscatus]
MSEVPRLRYTARTIARPMPISAAAMAMVKRVRASPSCSVSSAVRLSQTSKATRFRLTALSISSTDIRTRIALRRARTPYSPVQNRRADSTAG